MFEVEVSSMSLHGAVGDGGALDDQDYERVLADTGLRTRGASIIWRCHVGRDRPNERAREAWDFLYPYIVEDQPLDARTPVVLQASRWDALKDPIGVIRGFAEHVPESTGAHPIYAGPSVAAVADDPEGLRVLQEARALRAEGFGLTVAEAMWKGRPVVASGIGGIRSQIVDGETGSLLDDPRGPRAFGEAVTGPLLDSERAKLLGQRARARVRDEFTSPRSLFDYVHLIRRALERSGVRAAA